MKEFYKFKTDSPATSYIPLPRFLLTDETLKELESCKLIVRKKQGLGRPASISLNYPADAKIIVRHTETDIVPEIRDKPECI